jgi:arylsulfatase A-like enzyme
LIEPGGENATNMVLNIDFAPSIAELAGAVPDGPVDGQSILPLLKGEPVAEWRTDFLIEQYAGARIYQGLRHTSGTYAYYLNLGEEELYDHLVDVDQMESQAYNPAYDSIRLYCQDRIQQLMTNDALRVEF